MYIFSSLSDPLCQFTAQLPACGQRGEDELAVNCNRRKGNDAKSDGIVQLIERVEFAPDDLRNQLPRRCLKPACRVSALQASRGVKEFDLHRAVPFTPFARSRAPRIGHSSNDLPSTLHSLIRFVSAFDMIFIALI